MKYEAFDTLALEEIFKFDSVVHLRLSSRENGQLEFKESFNIQSAPDYARTMAAFANASGGYLVFGVKDKPRDLMGLTNNAFDNLDPAKLTEHLNSALAPELHWEQTIHTVKGKKVGIIYVHEARNKPVVCTKNSGDRKEGDIYYRYRGRSEKIKYPELRQILEGEREQERQLWMTMLQKMARMGIENVGILNSTTGQISGASGSLLISEELLPKLKFITSGRLSSRKGHPS
ncbi:MAG: hypothetical protein QOJ99_3038 [Bryobacterales bacterium]|jgi:hypothetical protein|nr:hypothetical protein [Bryobacterales bacterium]